MAKITLTASVTLQEARLLKSAPELLEELKVVCDYLEQLALYEKIELADEAEKAALDRVLINAAATIAKAEGRA